MWSDGEGFYRLSLSLFSYACLYLTGSMYWLERPVNCAHAAEAIWAVDC